MLYYFIFNSSFCMFMKPVQAAGCPKQHLLQSCTHSLWFMLELPFDFLSQGLMSLVNDPAPSAQSSRVGTTWELVLWSRQSLVGRSCRGGGCQPSGSLFFLPSSDFNEELLVTSPVKCLPVSCYDFYPDNSRLNLSNCKSSEFFSFIKVYLVIMSLYIYRTLTFESSPPGNCHKILTTKLPLN